MLLGRWADAAAAAQRSGAGWTVHSVAAFRRVRHHDRALRRVGDSRDVRSCDLRILIRQLSDERLHGLVPRRRGRQRLQPLPGGGGINAGPGIGQVLQRLVPHRVVGQGRDPRGGGRRIYARPLRDDAVHRRLRLHISGRQQAEQARGLLRRMLRHALDHAHQPGLAGRALGQAHHPFARPLLIARGPAMRQRTDEIVPVLPLREQTRELDRSARIAAQSLMRHLLDRIGAGPPVRQRLRPVQRRVEIALRPPARHFLRGLIPAAADRHPLDQRRRLGRIGFREPHRHAVQRSLSRHSLGQFLRPPKRAARIVTHRGG